MDVQRLPDSSRAETLGAHVDQQPLDDARTRGNELSLVLEDVLLHGAAAVDDGAAVALDRVPRTTDLPREVSREWRRFSLNSLRSRYSAFIGRSVASLESRNRRPSRLRKLGLNGRGRSTIIFAMSGLMRSCTTRCATPTGETAGFGPAASVTKMFPPLEVGCRLWITDQDQALARDLRPIGLKPRRARVIEHRPAIHYVSECLPHCRNAGATRRREARELGSGERNTHPSLGEPRTLPVAEILFDVSLCRRPLRIAIRIQQATLAIRPCRRRQRCRLSATVCGRSCSPRKDS